MKFVWVFVAIAGTVIAVILLPKSSTETTAPPQQSPATPTSQADQSVDFTATFAIITNGITRNFNASMYHNLSPDAYIQGSDSTIVHVKKTGVTWADFFNSLPFKLTKDCLTTGTKETFCTGKEGTLRFYLDGVEDPNLLDKEIKQGTHATIEF